MHRDFDLVLVGATGYVGRLTAAHLAHAAPSDLSIALAGRSTERLEQVRAQLPPSAQTWPLIQVDVTDHEACEELAASTTTIVTTVGPYAVRGLPLVTACAKAGTHYADLTAEILFVHETVAELHEVAEKTSARIVHACGFDSVPSDLGVWLTAQQALHDGAGGLTETVLTVRRLRGGLSGGTIDSVRQQVIAARCDATARTLLGDREALSGPEPADGRAVDPASRRRPPGLLGRSPVLRESGSGRWRVPFFMGSFNVPLVRRSHALTEGGYGAGFRYRELMDVGAGITGAARGAALVGGLAAALGGMAFRPTRAVLDRFLPAPGDGPSATQRARGAFTMEIIAGADSGARYRTIVSADLDPGYDGTAVMLGQAGLALAAGEGNGAGVLTPATALGGDLVDRLRAQDFTLTTEVVEG